NGEDVAIRLLVLDHGVALARVAAEAPRIDGEHVDTRLAFSDPLSQLPARTASRSDAEAVTFIDPQIARAPSRADQRTAVRRVRDGTVDDALDAAVLERRDATIGGFDMRQQTIEIARQQVPTKRARHAIREHRGGAALVRPKNPARTFFTQVPRLVRLTQHG